MSQHADAPTGQLTRVGPPVPVPPKRRPRAPSTAVVVLLVLGAAASGAGLRLATDDSAPAPDTPVRRCWDATPPGPRGCDVDDVGAQFWAFGLSESDCRPDPSYGHEHNTLSYECVVEGLPVHLASYASVDARARRISRYGPRTDLGGGRVFAGGPDQPSGRFLRTYDSPAAAAGLLMYVSVDAGAPGSYAVVNGLVQRPADELLHGEPITTSE